MLENINLRNFRIYENTSIPVNGSFMALVGKNDVGKSSVLQALDMLFSNRKTVSPSDRRNKDTVVSLAATVDGIEHSTNPGTVNFHYFQAENYMDHSIDGNTISELIASKNNITPNQQQTDEFKSSICHLFDIYQCVNDTRAKIDTLEKTNNPIMKSRILWLLSNR